MTQPNLSAAQRSYMNDPEGFRRRMERRAEELFVEGYRIRPGDEVGLFLVSTPNAQEYPVNLLSGDCACPYQQKAEIPQVPCKHLMGGEGLIVEMLAHLKQFAELGAYHMKAAREEEYRCLLAHWQATQDAIADRQHQEETAGAGVVESDRADRLTRETGFQS